MGVQHNMKIYHFHFWQVPIFTLFTVGTLDNDFVVTLIWKTWNKNELYNQSQRSNSRKHDFFLTFLSVVNKTLTVAEYENASLLSWAER